MMTQQALMQAAVTNPAAAAGQLTAAAAGQLTAAAGLPMLTSNPVITTTSDNCQMPSIDTIAPLQHTFQTIPGYPGLGYPAAPAAPGRKHFIPY